MQHQVQININQVPHPGVLLSVVTCQTGLNTTSNQKFAAQLGFCLKSVLLDSRKFYTNAGKSGNLTQFLFLSVNFNLTVLKNRTKILENGQILEKSIKRCGNHTYNFTILFVESNQGVGSNVG